MFRFHVQYLNEAFSISILHLQLLPLNLKYEREQKTGHLDSLNFTCEIPLEESFEGFLK